MALELLVMGKQQWESFHYFSSFNSLTSFREAGVHFPAILPASQQPHRHLQAL